MPQAAPAVVPLFGHEALRARLGASADAGRLPSAMLFAGPAGIGKQRLALWLGQRLLCTAPAGAARPCGECRACTWAASLTHPDLTWVYPRPRLKDSDASAAEVWEDLASATAERVANGLLYPAVSGAEAIYVATVRALLKRISMTPAVGTRKVIVIGDAQRMVPQEGADAAANAFLKVLEEPPADTTLLLTSSEPGALLPTIRSRLVSVRVAPLPDRDVGAFVGHDLVRAKLSGTADTLVPAAAGAPGRLLSTDTRSAAQEARAMLDAALSPRDGAALYRAALRQGAAGARGAYAERLEALTVLLHARARAAVERGALAHARAASDAVAHVERTKELADANANPQLLTVAMLRAIRERAS